MSVRLDEELIHDTPPTLKSTAIISDGENSIQATAIVGVDLSAKGMQMPQRTGAASSYAKKYSLGNLLLLDDTKDSDATNTHGKEKPALKLGSPEYKRVKSALSAGKATIAQVRTKYIVSTEIEKSLNQ